MKKYLLAAAVSCTMLTADAQWTVQDPGFRNDSLGFYEISLPRQNTAWAVCYDGWGGLLSGKPILDFTRTTNGGNTWIPGKMGNDKTLRFSNISAINNEEAWVAMHKIGPTPGNYAIGSGGSFAHGGGIFHTKNGGLTWKQSNPGELFDHNSIPRFVHFKNEDRGVAVGDPVDGYFEIYLTENGGKKWKRVARRDIPAPMQYEVGWISGFAAIGNKIWFGTSTGRMYKSVNFGKTWTVHVVDPVPGTHIHEIAFLDDGLRGVAHGRNPGTNRTFVFSTLDGGLTWTNYFQPANWKNSRMTAVPGTNAFISTAVHANPAFQGSAVSYDVGQTWTEIDNAADKAVCRFYDANTGYAGGFYITGNPVLGTGGIFKSTITFQADRMQTQSRVPALAESSPGKLSQESEVTVYPVPASDIINISFNEKTMNNMQVINIIDMNGKPVATKTATGRLVQMDVSKIPAGSYTLRIAGNTGKAVSKVITIVK